METTTNKETTRIYTAKTQKAKRISFVWLLPLAIFGVLCWIAYDTYANKGTSITIVFKNGEGLKEGVTPLEYKGLQLGKVTKIEIGDDLKSVKATILLQKEAAKFITNGNSRFWIQKPTVSLTKISGLNTLFSGYKIELSPITTDVKALEGAQLKTSFVGFDEKPSEGLEKDGYYISLLGTDKNNVEVGTPLFYNNYQIGEIVSKELLDGKTLLSALIYEKHKSLVNKSSKFIMNHALKVNFGAGGLSVEVGNLYAAIVGGITVVTENKNAAMAQRGEQYQIYEEKDEATDRIKIAIKFLNADGIGVDTPIIYKGITVGKIVNMELRKNAILSEAFVYDKYKYLLTTNTRFFVAKPDIGIGGIKNLDAIVKGNYVSFNYESGKFANTFDAIEYQAGQDNLRSVELTLYADELGSIGRNAKIYFKNIAVGHVVDYGLSEDFGKVKIKAAIDEKYKKLINDTTLFYDLGSKLVEIKNLNLNINYNGAEPLLNGGIALVDINSSAGLSKKSFKLYSSYKDVERIKRVSANGFAIKAFFNNGFNIQKDMPLIYKNREIGFIKDIGFAENQSPVEIFIYEEYKKYITPKSRFYKKAAVNIQANLSGLIFEVENFSSLLFGSLQLSNDSNAACKKYEIFASEEDMRNQTSYAGKIYKVASKRAPSAGVDSPVYYKNVQIGKISRVDLNGDGSEVVMECLIYDKYAKLIRKNSKFYDISGFNMNFSLFSGAKIETNTVASIIKGGLLVVTPINYAGRADFEDKFTLENKPQDDWQNISPAIEN